MDLLLGIAVIALVISIAGPRAVHASVTTPAQMMNTSANPVPTVAMDNPAPQHQNTEAVSGSSFTAGALGFVVCVGALRLLVRFWLSPV
jgi:2,3-bisphosphoglycerate-independent phosphoglycerate mutase